MKRLALAEFNQLPAEEAGAALAPLCPSEAWRRVLVASRPFVTPGEVAATSDGVLNAMGWRDVQATLAEEPDLVPAAVRDTLEAERYQARFGVPFVLDPIGKTAEQITALLVGRLAADEADEQRTVRRELAAIVRIRLAKTLG